MDNLLTGNPTFSDFSDFVKFLNLSRSGMGHLPSKRPDAALLFLGSIKTEMQLRFRIKWLLGCLCPKEVLSPIKT